VNPQGELVNQVVYISKCSGCRSLEPVSVLSTPKGCVLVSIRDENDSCKGHDSAYAFNSIISDIIIEF
jgi:hypothetical protein